MAAVLSARLPEPTLRKVLLTGHRYTAQEALKEGLVDEVIEAEGSEGTIAYAVEKAKAMSPLAATGVRLPSSSRSLDESALNRTRRGAAR